MAYSTKALSRSSFRLIGFILIGGMVLLSAPLFPATSLAGPVPVPTPTFIPGTCGLNAGSGVLLASRLATLTLPLSGSQVWRFGPLEPDLTRKILVLPTESHFDCTGTIFAGMNVKICARLDPTTYCNGGVNDGLACPPAVCGVGGTCDINPGQGMIDCSPGGGSITGYDELLQIDHDTNRATVAGQPNTGFPADPQCTATFTDVDGSVLHSCIEPEATDVPTPTTGPGTPTPTPKSTPTARAAAAATCTGPFHPHPDTCNSPTTQAFSGISEAGGFGLHEAIDLSFEIGADCSTPCPPDSLPLQPDELQLTGVLTSGKAKGVVWNANNSAQIFGTTGAGNGANVCGTVIGGPQCPTTITGFPVDLSGLGGDCLGGVPTIVNGALGALVLPAIDIDPTLGDAVTTLTLECGTPAATRTPTITPNFTDTPTPTSTRTITPTRTPLGACPAAPDAGCLQPQRGSSISLKSGAPTAGWKWLGGSTPVSLGQYGDPVNGSTSYHWCVYDTSAGPPFLAFEARVQAGGTCGARPCWKQSHNRLSYSNPAGTPDGVTSMTLRASGGSGASITVRARGSNLHLPVSADGIYLLREFPEVIVQLQRNDTPGCWEAVFTNPAIHNTQRTFVDSIH